MAIRYQNFDNFSLHTEYQPWDDLKDLLTDLLITRSNALIDAKKGIPLKVP
jgi:hypothetical protein